MIENITSKVSGLKESFLFFFILALSFGDTCFSQNIELEKAWTGNLKSFLESAPTVADIDNDGNDEIVVAGQEELIALEGNGKIIWRWKTRQRYMTYPAVLKRKNKPALIFAADNSGQMTCLNGDGKVVWQADLSAGAEWSASVVADIDNNGSYEVVQADMGGTVWLFDALSGKVVKQMDISEGKLISPAVGDIDGDGKSEIVVAANNGNVYALTNDLSKIWEYQIGGSSETWATSAPVIFAASDGKAYIIAASSSGDIYCFDNTGKPIWEFPTGAPVASSISIGDYDQNGVADIFLITQTGVVYRFDEFGSKIWNIDMQGRSLAPGAIFDINNDNAFEYVFSTQRGNMFVLDSQGDVMFNHQFNSRTINVTPSFGNVNGKSNRYEVVLTGGEEGLVYCLRTPAKAKAAKQWSSYRGNINNTGAWFGLKTSNKLRMIPQNLSWDNVFVGKDIRFKIYNPKPTKSALRVEAQCIDPGGIKYHSIASVYGKAGELLLPVDLIVPGDYKFSWKVIGGKGKTLLEDRKTISIQPFINDQALVSQALEKLKSTIVEIDETLPLSSNVLRSTVHNLKMEYADLLRQQNTLPGNSGSQKQKAIEQTRQLTQKATEASDICEVLSSAKLLGSETSIIAFEGSKWENRDVDKQLPKICENPLSIRQTAVMGEHSPVPVVLFNITDQFLNVRIEYEELPGLKINPLHSINTITALGNESWDAMPEFDESAIITIPPLKSREVWLDIDLAKADAGNYQIEVLFQSLNGAGIIDASSSPHGVPAPETKVDIFLEVLPFVMAPSGEFRLCTWSPSTGPEIDGLLAHGNNVFLLHNAKIEYNDNDEITRTDFSEMDKVINQFSNRDVFFLLHGMPKLNGEFGSAKYKEDYQQYLRLLLTFLSKKNIDLQHFALYPVDEPGGHGWAAVNEVIKIGEMAHEVNPDIMIYQDGGGELPMFEAMSRHLDVWVPPFDWLSLDKPEMDVMRNTGELLWSYNCAYTSARPVGPNIKNINLIHEYRTAALHVLRHGATGIGYWVYSAGSENQWSRIKYEYSLVYPGRSKSVTSRRWEAVREGIEDYRIVAALKKYLDDNNLDLNSRKHIEHLINVSLPQLVDPVSKAVLYGQSRGVIDDLANEQKMNIFRKEMIECVKSTLN